MFDGEKRFSEAALIEGAYYSMQTITTVGYGNWVPTNLEEKKDKIDAKILNIKLISVPFMFFGAALFATLVGLVVHFLTRSLSL